MSKDIVYKVGDICENTIRQFTKIISVRDNIFGLSGWTNRANAEKSTIAIKFLNIYGMESAGITVVKGSSKKDAPSSSENTDTKPTKSSLSKLSAPAVKELCEKFGLSTDGIKADMLDRLYTHYKL